MNKLSAFVAVLKKLGLTQNNGHSVENLPFSTIYQRQDALQHDNSRLLRKS